MNNRFLLVILLFLGIAIGCSKNSDDNDPQPISVDKSANLKTTGDSANEILSNDTFDKLKIEIAYVQGFMPTSSAMTDFVSFLNQHTFKQDIDIVYQELPSPNEEKLTLEEIFDLEKKNRTVYNDGSTLAIYIYFADAPSEGDNEEEDLVTLGAVYLNTSMVIYEDTIRTLAGKSSLVSVADIEIATLNHEFGHLLGLVDLGSTPVNEHEDVDSENHCNVVGCLMRAELQFGASSGKNSQSFKITDGDMKASCSLSGNSVLHMLRQQVTSKGIAEAPGLGSECILDLQANGGN